MPFYRILCADNYLEILERKYLESTPQVINFYFIELKYWICPQCVIWEAQLIKTIELARQGSSMNIVKIVLPFSDVV
jgi:hypothetical protein